MPHGPHSQSPSTIPPPLELDANPVSSTLFATIAEEQCPPPRKRKLSTNMPVHSKAGGTRKIVGDIPPLPPPRRAQILAVRAPPKMPKLPSSRRRQHKAKTPPHRAIIFSSKEELSSATSCNDSESDTKESTPESHNSDVGVFRVVKHDHVLHAQPLPTHDDIIRA